MSSVTYHSPKVRGSTKRSSLPSSSAGHDVGVGSERDGPASPAATQSSWPAHAQMDDEHLAVVEREGEELALAPAAAVTRAAGEALTSSATRLRGGRFAGR